ncbi:MAG: hypothetical protein LBN33_02955 [Desulfovibrio sp.]|jgi:hypothetical protein|nr:hypothetical protein [Desulfovibrio sp.]
MRHVFSKISVLILCAVLSFMSMGTALAQSPVATVAQMKDEKALNDMVKASSSVTYDIMTDPGGEIFWIVSQVDGAALQLYSVLMDEDTFKLRRGERDANLLHDQKMKKGEAFVLRTLVPDSLPNLTLCLTDLNTGAKDRKCWTPRFNGENGALTLDPGFVPPPSAARGKIKYEQAETPLVDGGTTERRGK